MYLRVLFTQRHLYQSTEVTQPVGGKDKPTESETIYHLSPSVLFVILPSKKTGVQLSLARQNRDPQVI